MSPLVLLAAAALILPAPVRDPGAPPGPAARHHLRALRIDVGVAWGLAALGLVGVLAPLAALAACPRERACEGALPLVPGFAALTAAALLPAVVYTRRLAERRRPLTLGLGPAGLALRF